MATTQSLGTSKGNGSAAIASLPKQALLHALQKVRAGDFTVRLPGNLTGIEGKIADTFNEIVAANARMAAELKRVGLAVGKKGQTSQRVRFQPLGGEWGEMEASTNALIDDLLWPTTEVTRAVSAVAQGDLLKTVPLEVEGRPLKGEFLRSANIVNTMIQQLVVFTSEVTRVAREVGTDGKLGGQAEVRGVSGVWKDLTDSVNSMANNLTAQVRNIADVTIAVASGDLPRKSPWTCGARFSNSRKPSIPWWTSCGHLPARLPAWRAKSARRAGWAARPWCRASAARGKT